MSMDLIDHLPPALYPFLTRPAATPTLDRPDLVKLLRKRSNSGYLIQDLAGNTYSFAKSKIVPDLVSHDGNSTLFLKFEHDSEFICLPIARGLRCEVDLGSNPSLAGVTSAFRFCVMESSIAPLDIRRKSGGIH